jgi:stress response protein SCP2
MLRNVFFALVLAPHVLAGCETVGAPEGQDQVGDDESYTPVSQAVTSATNLIPANQAGMTSDSNKDGLADGFVKTAGTGNTVTYSVSNTGGQKIKITASTTSNAASATYNTFYALGQQSDIDAAVDVKLVAAGKVSARLDVIYYNNGSFLQRTSSPVYKLSSTPTTPVYERIYVAKHRMPASATHMKVAVVLLHQASGTIGEATFRNIGVGSSGSSSCSVDAGKACLCGGTVSCNGMCEGGTPIPAAIGDACGCGGTIDCSGTCTVPCINN